MSTPFGILPDRSDVIGEMPAGPKAAGCQPWVRVEWYSVSEIARLIAFEGWEVVGEATFSGPFAGDDVVMGLARETYAAMGGVS